MSFKLTVCKIDQVKQTREVCLRCAVESCQTDRNGHVTHSNTRNATHCRRAARTGHVPGRARARANTSRKKHNVEAPTGLRKRRSSEHGDSNTHAPIDIRPVTFAELFLPSAVGESDSPSYVIAPYRRTRFTEDSHLDSPIVIELIPSVLWFQETNRTGREPSSCQLGSSHSS